AFVEWLTDRIERRVLEEFGHLSERGGVLGAMETGYQRSKIQEESLHYERLKHSGEHPIVGVNTFVDTHRGEDVLEAAALTRSTKEEKEARLAHVRDFQQRHAGSHLEGAPTDSEAGRSSTIKIWRRPLNKSRQRWRARTR
ncbi:MAG TPA: methylmalonyl-CoA mutase family protein, partial [Thermoanaerobaculaceae bacterium]|nr:methylmalonyl-CoA mutase family protein [Thermoanaerobaculaceae bacterium]